MKTLYLLRHAWPHAAQGQSDFSRELTPRGENDAANLALTLKKQGVLPDIILSSAAPRALKTAQIIAEGIGYKSGIVIVDSLYLAESEHLLKTVQAVKSKADSVLVVGHNMGLSYFASGITKTLINLPPGGFVGITFEIDSWKKLSSGGHIVLHLVP